MWETESNLTKSFDFDICMEPKPFLLSDLKFSENGARYLTLSSDLLLSWDIVQEKYPIFLHQQTAGGKPCSANMPKYPSGLAVVIRETQQSKISDRSGRRGVPEKNPDLSLSFYVNPNDQMLLACVQLNQSSALFGLISRFVIITQTSASDRIHPTCPMRALSSRRSVPTDSRRICVTTKQRPCFTSFIVASYLKNDNDQRKRKRKRYIDNTGRKREIARMLSSKPHTASVPAIRGPYQRLQTVIQKESDNPRPREQFTAFCTSLTAKVGTA
jgi:hypothetical protein